MFRLYTVRSYCLKQVISLLLSCVAQCLLRMYIHIFIHQSISCFIFITNLRIILTFGTKVHANRAPSLFSALTMSLQVIVCFSVFTWYFTTQTEFHLYLAPRLILTVYTLTACGEDVIQAEIVSVTSYPMHYPLEGTMWPFMPYHAYIFY